VTATEDTRALGSNATPGQPRGAEEDVRARIFDSALRLFSQRGYAATSLREVAEDAGASKPMIYYYFGSKEQLYGSIVQEILEEMASAIRHRLTAADSPRERLLEFCRAYLEYFMTNEDVIALVLREVFGLGDAMRRFSETLGEQVRRPLDEILADGMASGAFQADHVGRCATAVTGVLNMFILAHVFGGSTLDRDVIVHQVEYYAVGLCKT
jgi:AcrR family transcriptional regulator